MTAIRLTLAILLLAGLTAANTKYERIDSSDFVTRGDAYQGRLVAVTGEVCAVNADGKSVRLFDPDTRALIDVTLNQMNRSQRRSLMLNPVRHVSVYGRAEVINGRVFIEAHQVIVRPTNEVATRKSDSKTARG